MLLDACLVAEEVLAPPTGKSQETPEVYTDEDVKSCGTLGPKVRSGLCAFFRIPDRLSPTDCAPPRALCVCMCPYCVCMCLSALQPSDKLETRRETRHDVELDVGRICRAIFAD